MGRQENQSGRQRGRGQGLCNRSWGRSHPGPLVSHHVHICLHTGESQMAAEHILTQRERTRPEQNIWHS
ncbi:unnamed protein product [Tetraodon nigroviridis]|uniref:(spotted green pufferfish) hypothetical protein n=1 Tax=Tetraodon nigroviridis TaxID=99883 RepID=Q4RM93_TETNG|nr:unnamed protein product [Tetraodon nigroviridis]